MATTKQTPRFFRIAQLIGIIGVSLLVINFIYQLWRLHANNEAKTAVNICNLQVGSCSKHLPNNQTLTLSITPIPIQSNNTSTATVTLKGMTPEHVAVIVFPYPATKPASKPIMLTLQQDGTYVGNVFIKKTSSAKQKWVAMVVLQNGNQEISAPFQFEVKN
jgi:hypothetical protein